MRPRSIFIRGSLAALCFITAVAVAAWMVGSNAVAPTNHPVRMPGNFAAQPVSIQGPGHLIAGWWIDGSPDSPVVLVLHGVRADRTSMVPRAELLQRHGFSVLLIDQQAHGETPGKAITMGLRESADVAAARDWIRAQAPGRRIGAIGCSMGGASILLGKQPAGFDAVVLESVYPRISQAVEDRVRIRVGPFAPILSRLLLLQLELRLRIEPSELEPIRSIGYLGAPVLILAGSRDEHTTLAESRELFEAASPPKSMWIVEGARHQDLLAYDPQGYDAHVVEFLIETLGNTAR
jgi:uncharacterized protein